MNTHYAPAERAKEDQLEEEIDIINHSPIMEGLLQTVGGLLAVVNEQRQVVACNDKLLSALGIDDPHSLLGLRPGEVLECVHAHDCPAGCGTTKFCSSCGAALAMVSSLETNACSEQLCALKTERNGEPVEIALMVRSQPIKIGDKRFLLLFLQDISRQELQAALERTFFHDVHNTLHIMAGASELLQEEHSPEDVITIRQTTERLIQEVALQRRLLEGSESLYHSPTEQLNAEQLIQGLCNEIKNHAAAAQKNITVEETNHSDWTLRTDRSLLMRILTNMLINAYEATPAGGTIKIGLERTDNTIDFTVWNKETIPPGVQRRIFQRHFSTKKEPGRGIGTYSMKLFGEQYLHGKVSFTSSPEQGTTFRLALPT